MKRKLSKGFISFAVMLATLLLMIAISSVSPGISARTYRVKDYDIYINEKKNVSVDIQVEKYDSNAMYFVAFIDSKESRWSQQLNYNKGKLYSDNETSNRFQGATSVSLKIVKDGITKEVKIAEISFVSDQKVEFNDLLGIKGSGETNQ